MTTFPGSPRLLKGGLVLIDLTNNNQRIIALQYNPDSLSRTLQVQGAGGEGGDRSRALRLTGPPVETIKVEVEIDATDQIGAAEPNPVATQYGISPELAVLELMIYPSSRQLADNNSLARQGKLEIIPTETPLTLFVWGKNRVIPVRLTEFSITEESFDTALNPIRAKVNLGMRVLSVSDLGFEHRGGTLYLRYQQEKERLARLYPGGSFTTLGITGVL